MNRHFSLRWRLVISLLGVFLLGVGSTVIFFQLERQEIQDELRHIPDSADRLTVQFNEMIEGDIEFLGYILIPFTIAAVGVILAVTHWSLRSLRRISHYALDIDINRLDQRLDLSGLPIEIVPLVEGMNATLDRLAAAYSAEQRLTADAAHELRTPLAVLQTRLQTAKLGDVIEWPAIDQDLGQLERVIAQIIDLARKESRSRARELRVHESVNLARTLREAAAQVLPLVESMHRAVEIEAPNRIMVEGSADELRDMLRNLLENALYHGRGVIRGSVRHVKGDSDEHVVITVSDDGDGVPEGMREAVFERFRKLSPGSRGAGLGLAIVRRVAHDHGGKVQFPSGLQCIVQIILPGRTQGRAS